MTSESAAAVVASGLTVTRGSGRTAHTVLRDLNFTVEPGSVTGIVGPSGCGKTTLLRSIVGVQRYTGTLEVLGVPAGSKANRSQIGYVTQASSVYDGLTVWQNIEYFASLFPQHTDVADILDVLDLTELARKKPPQLSGGQRGRVSLGCALVGDPKLLVLDEPTGGLDPLTRERIWSYLETVAATGVTILISTHVMDEAARCQDMLLLRAGELLSHATPKKLLDESGEQSLDAAFLTLIKRQLAKEQ